MVTLKLQTLSLTQYIRLLVFISSATPSLWLFYHYQSNSLGLNPFETLMAVSGHCSLIFLTLTLAITPFRRWLIILFRQFPKLKWGKRLSDWNLLIKLRRMLGVYSFYYACIHGWGYLDLELDWLFEEFVWEINNRHFISLGLFGWLMLFVLSITSPKFMLKKMKKWWRTLHRIMYPLCLIVCFHYLLSTKETNEAPYYYLIIILVLLGHRLVVKFLPDFKQYYDNGLEAKR